MASVYSISNVRSSPTSRWLASTIAVASETLVTVTTNTLHYLASSVVADHPQHYRINMKPLVIDVATVIADYYK